MYILHFRNGSTAEFASPPAIDTRTLTITTSDPETVAQFSNLKAVFFLNVAPDPHESAERSSGSFITVEFEDGEIIRGFARYNPAAPGFFLYPAEKGKNERLFVIASFVSSVEIAKV